MAIIGADVALVRGWEPTNEGGVHGWMDGQRRKRERVNYHIQAKPLIHPSNIKSLK
jgi:hypothetical protein